MSKIQYVLDKESPFIKKLYGKEDNFKVETLTYFGTLYELEKLQNQIEVLEKALELACEDKPRPIKYYGNYMGGVNDYIEFYKTKAKEMIKSE